MCMVQTLVWHDTVSHAVYARSSRRPGTHTSTDTAKCRMELVRRMHKGVQRGKEEVQVDYSKDGLGAALGQDGKPIEPASRSLTATERRWAQIEKELLSVVFGLDRFDRYTYGGHPE